MFSLFCYNIVFIISFFLKFDKRFFTKEIFLDKTAEKSVVEMYIAFYIHLKVVITQYAYSILRVFGATIILFTG